MRFTVKMISVIFALCLLCAPVFAAESALMEGISPEEHLEPSVREQLGSFDPEETNGFAERFRSLFRNGVEAALGSIGSAGRTAGIVLAIVLLCGLLGQEDSRPVKAVSIAGTLAITAACAGDLHSMVALGTETITQTNQYALLLLPGLSTLMSAAGSVTGAGALYVGSVFFLQLLMTAMSRLLVPLVYLFSAICATEAALEQSTLAPLRDFVKWLTVTVLKTIMYAFTAYLSFTGLLSGSVDGVKLKAARLAMSGTVPVVGGIISDASQTLLTAAAALKNVVGIYGMLAVLAICLTPFLRIWLHFLLLKAVTAIGGLLGRSSHVGLLSHLSEAMGIVTGMTGSYCLMALLSLILCIKAVGY